MIGRSIAAALAAGFLILGTSFAQPPEPGQYLLPKDAKSVKGAFFITSGFRFKEYREVAAKHDLVLIQFMGSAQARQTLLAKIAKESNRPEIEHANYVVWGHSAGGVGAAKVAAEMPDRVIACCVIRSPNEKDGPLLKTPEAMMKVPVIITPALRDGFVPVSAPTALHARGRKENSVWTLAVEPGGTHAPESASALVAAWLDAVIPLRLPADADYSKGRVKMNEIDPKNGWLGETKTFEISSAEKFAGDNTGATWLPNEEFGKLWKAFVGTAQSPSRPVPAVPQPGRPGQPGTPKQGQPQPPKAGKSFLDVEYAKIGTKSLKANIFLPEKGDGPFPLVIHIHGGGWSGGSYKSLPPNAEELIAGGYAVASIQYRLSGEAIFPAAIQDCKLAVRWLRANAKQYNFDPDRFAAWGSSAGGHLVALLGTSGGVKEFEVGDHPEASSKVQAVCDWFGPTDFSQMNTQAKVLGNSAIDHDSPRSP